MSNPNRYEQFERSIARNVIRGHRTSRGWSQQQLADAMQREGFTGMLQTTIAKIEAGTRPIRLAEFVGFAHAFGMPWQSMLVDVEPTLDARDPLNAMVAEVNIAQRMEDDARETMERVVQEAVRDYASAFALREARASEYRRLSEKATAASPLDARAFLRGEFGDAPATNPAN